MATIIARHFGRFVSLYCVRCNKRIRTKDAARKGVLNVYCGCPPEIHQSKKSA